MDTISDGEIGPTERLLAAMREVTTRQLPRIPDPGEPGAAFGWENPATTREHFLAWRDRMATRYLQEVQQLASGRLTPVPGVETERNVIAISLLREDLWQGQSVKPQAAPRVEAFLDLLNPGVTVRDPLEAGAAFEGQAADAQGDLPPGVYSGTLVDTGGQVRVVVATLPRDVWSTASAAFPLDSQTQALVASITQTVIARSEASSAARLGAVERHLARDGRVAVRDHLDSSARATASGVLGREQRLGEQPRSMVSLLAADSAVSSGVDGLSR